MPDEPDAFPGLLFVYGTLRHSCGGAGTGLVRHLHSEGRATMRGLLYDLGDYPGMVPGDGVVHGDVLRIERRADLDALDHYEECGGPRPLFRRERLDVWLAHGKPAVAWAYLYARSIEGAPRIESGDYPAWHRHA